MSDYMFEGLQLVAKHVPDYSTEVDAHGQKVKQELPGQLVIGTEIEGVFVPLLTRMAAGLFADIKRLQLAQADAAEAQQQQAQVPGTSTSTSTATTDTAQQQQAQ